MGVVRFFVVVVGGFLVFLVFFFLCVWITDVVISYSAKDDVPLRL